jgi:hypothetical protein
MTIMSLRRLVVSTAIVAFLGLASGCGYALAGRNNNLPPHIKRIGIVPCVNQSSLPDIDQIVTAALLEEFQSRGKFQVKPEAAGADAVMTCSITNVTPTAIEFTAQRQASKYSVSVSGNIEFRDKTDNDKVIWANPSATARDEYPVTSGTDAADPAAYLRQNRNALERLAKTFARSVVTSILEAF